MKKFSSLTVLISFVSFMLFMGCNSGTQQQNDQQTAPAETTAEDMVKRGEYLVNLGGCHDCHAPKEMTPQGPQPIKALWLSGYPSERTIMTTDAKIIEAGWALINYDITQAVGPWGVSFSANLTSDQSGIGNWTEENFMRALKEGKFKGMANSRTLLPPMPWQNFANVKDEDIRAIFAYLKSTPPVANVVPAAIIADQQPPSQVSPTAR